MRNGISTSRIFPLLLAFAITFTCLGSGGPEVESMSMTHRMMMLAMQLGVVLFAARIGNAIAMRIGLPGVLGELGAGVLIGPFMLWHIPLPGFESGIFPIFSSGFPVSPELYGLCAIASVILLFMVGLETDLPLFLRYSVAGTVVGISGVVFSFLAGSMSGWVFLPMIFGTKVEMLSPACIFLGIMSTATSVGISSRILPDKKKLDTPEGVTRASFKTPREPRWERRRGRRCGEMAGAYHQLSVPAISPWRMPCIRPNPLGGRLFWRECYAAAVGTD